MPLEIHEWGRHHVDVDRVCVVVELAGIAGKTAWVSREVIFVWPRPAGKAHNRCSLCRVRPPNYHDGIKGVAEVDRPWDLASSFPAERGQGPGLTRKQKRKSGNTTGSKRKGSSGCQESMRKGAKQGIAVHNM